MVRGNFSDLTYRWSVFPVISLSHQFEIGTQVACPPGHPPPYQDEMRTKTGGSAFLIRSNSTNLRWEPDWWSVFWPILSLPIWDENKAGWSGSRNEVRKNAKKENLVHLIEAYFQYFEVNQNLEFIEKISLCDFIQNIEPTMRQGEAFHRRHLWRWTFALLRLCWRN